MWGLSKQLDPSSMIVLAITLILFIVAIVVKGLTHELLLEAAVFLVSMKLIIMSAKNNRQTNEMKNGLRRIQGAIERVENSLREPTEPG